MGSTHHLGTLYADRSHAALSLLFFAVLWVYLFYVIRAAFHRFSAFAPTLFDNPNKSRSLFASAAKPKLKLFLCSFAILLIMWSPYVISTAPGMDCVDMGWQISQFVNGSYSTHHPLFATFIYGIVFSAGNAIAGINSGLMAMTLFQTFALALVLSFEIVVLYDMNFSKPALIAALAFFALAPVFGTYCQWIVKDSLFGAVFALYVTLYARCCLRAEKEGVSIRDLSLLLGASVATGLLRNNAFYAIAFAAVAFVLVFRKKLSLTKIGLMLAVIPLVLAFNQAALVATNAQKGDIREALSIPFQQSARYALEHSNDATQEEIEAIDAVLDYSDLAERYKWKISDPVKDKAKTGDKAALAKYLQAWAAQGLRHPVCYTESFLDQTYGYWSLQNPRVYNREFGLIGNNKYIGKNLGTESMTFFPELASKASKIVKIFEDMPLFGLFSIAGFYTLVGISLAALALYRGKPKTLILLAPSAILLLTCMAGPLNGSIRYSFGIIAAFPIIVGAIIYMLFGCTRKKKSEQKLL